MPVRRTLWTTALLGLLAGDVRAQDVELLGRIYGTRPPAEYFRTLEEHPDAFEFGRAWRRRSGLPAPGPGAQGAEAGGPAAVLGQREGTVEGTFHFPLVLGLYSDSDQTPPYSVGVVQQQFFDGPSAGHGTIPEYYAEVSGGRVQLVGLTHDWRRTTLTRSQVTGGVSGLGGPARVGEFIVQILQQLDSAGVDWSVFDNDGPDGIPDSGDDDGFVDVLAVMHPTRGAECDGNQSSDRIWSHRWQISAQTGQPFVTSTPSARGGFIRIDDYTIQPVLSCDGQSINEIGVFAHELGHGFGLPDLYSTGSSRHPGAGNWDLMATGAWGCQGNRPSRPCHMGAWSKAVLGWVDVEDLPSNASLGTRVLPPVRTSRRVYRVPSGEGSRDYLLVENRQRMGFDQDLYAPGMLVWHIDPETVEARWPANGVNNDPERMGVWLRQADGRNDLASTGSGRGDAGDPFPGSTGNRSFHAGSNPGTFAHSGASMGVTFLDVESAGEDMGFRLLTHYQSLAVRTEGATGGGLVTVDGQAPAGHEVELRSAPFERHVFEAAPGEAVAAGVRTGFDSWEDGSPRVRIFSTGLRDSTLVARYAGTQLEVRVTLDAEGTSVQPGDLRTEPESEDGWFAEAAQVTLTAEPRVGFAFREWTGALAGAANPATVTLTEPLSAAGAFDVIYGVVEPPSSLELEAAVQHELEFQALNGNDPIQWSLAEGRLPQGMTLAGSGRLTGAPLETGRFEVVLRARDAIGLEATAALVLDVTRPRLGVAALAAPFLLQPPSLTSVQETFLDRAGNQNGVYDLGDLRAFLLANPDLPAAASVTGAVRTVVPVVDLRGREGPP